MDRTAETQVYSILTLPPPNDIIQLELIANHIFHENTESRKIMILIKEDDKCFKIILKSILLLIACAGVGFFALLLTYSFPREKMKEHVLKNADYYSQNDFLVEGYPSTRLDLYTDATMLSAAICPASENKIADVMLAPRRRLLGNENDRQLIANYTCEDETQVQYCYYPRYWHGYLTVLKPLLLFFSTEDLHLIYFFVQSCLLLSLTAALIKKNQLPLAVCFGIGVLLLNPMVTALNFQNASIYLILLLSLLFLVCTKKFDKDYLVNNQCFAFFQIIGIAVAYFDFLTYPIVALGVPLLFLLYFSDTADAKKRVIYVILHSVMFFAGYLGMYFCKWGLATLLTDVNVFKDAYEEFMILLNANSVEGAEITILEGLSRTISNYINPPYLLLITSGILYAMLTVRKAKFTSNWLCRNFSTALVALYPFCHMLASTHAYYHYFLYTVNL